MEGPHFLGRGREPRGARSARRAHAARGGARRPPRSDRVPLRPTAGAPGRRLRGRRRSRRPPRGRRATRWITSSGSRPGTRSDPGRWYAGTTPQGLFVSDDGGVTWEGVTGFNDLRASAPVDRAAARMRRPTAPRCTRSTSIRSIPRTSTSACPPAACSSRTTRAPTWQPLNRGCAADFLPDPACRVRPRPALPARASRRRATWSTSRTTAASTGSIAPRAALGCASARQCRTTIGDIGFPMVLHPRDPNTAWVFPMDGTDGVAARARSAASPPPTARATRAHLEAPGPRACRPRRRGSR